MLCGSAFKNKGVQPMLDAVVDFLPRPVDIPPTRGMDVKGIEELERKADDRRALLGAGVQDHDRPPPRQAHLRPGLLGQLKTGSQVLNSTKDRKERVGRILQMHANHREDRDAAFAGDIVALVGLKQTTTGDTLCDGNAPIVLESLDFPEPVIHVAVEPKTKNDQDKLSRALQALSEEDPTFQVHSDEETGQTVIGGMGELHLEVLVDRMLREFKVDANVGKPQVAYRETIKYPVKKVETRYIRQTGGRGQYGHVVLDLEPTGPGGGYEFVDKITGGDHPQGVHPLRRRRHPGRHAVRRAGRVPAGRHPGHPGVRFLPRRRQLGDGVQDRRLDVLQRRPAGRPTRSCSSPSCRSRWSPPRTTWATSSATCRPAGARSRAWSSGATRRSIRAQVPLAEMFGYATDLRSRTQGRATYSMQFNSYQEVPESVSKEIVARVRGE